jgi:hypothetical protein
MSLPNRLEKTSPADSDNPSAGAAQIRNLKGFLEDLFGVLDTQTYTAKAMDVGLAGQITIAQERMLLQNGNATTPGFGFSGATGTGLAYDGSTTAIAVLRNGSKVGHLGIPTRQDMGGIGQDSSAWTGVVRVDAGVWSASDDVEIDTLIVNGDSDETVSWGTPITAYDSFRTFSYANLHHTLPAEDSPHVNINVVTLLPDYPCTTGWHDHFGISSLIVTENEQVGVGHGGQSAIAVYAQAAVATPGGGGWGIGLMGYANHLNGCDGTLIGVDAEIYNRGTVGDVNSPKAVLWGGNHGTQATYGIYLDGIDNLATWGFEIGMYLNDCGFNYLFLSEPTGYPFGTPGTTIGIDMPTHANWGDAIKLPNDSWLVGHHSAGSTSTKLIKANDDDLTISLGGSASVAAAVAANFSATHMYVFYDVDGNVCYIPVKRAGW